MTHFVKMVVFPLDPLLSKVLYTSLLLLSSHAYHDGDRTPTMRATCGRFLRQDNWSNWQHSKYFQSDHYFDQGCFGNPTSVDKDDAVFHLVRTYTIKMLDCCKKTRCVCDGLSRSGLVKVLYKICANCLNQTSSRLFYAVMAAKNLFV
jgi:hypothetical protein